MNGLRDKKDGKHISFQKPSPLSFGSSLSGEEGVSSPSDQAAEVFLRALINIGELLLHLLFLSISTAPFSIPNCTLDAFNRMTVFAASEHHYVRFGAMRSEAYDSPDDTFVLVAEKLHSLRPVPSDCALPQRNPSGSGSGDAAEAAGWQRRQFSVLWAPMPPAYSLEGGTAEGSGLSTKGFSKVIIMLSILLLCMM